VNQNLIRLSQRYTSALRKHLKQGPRASLESARGLGRQAMAIGLETLDLARVHESALSTLEASSSRDGIIKRAEIFFTEAITPIENTHLAALKTKAHLSQLHKTLNRRTVDLAAANRSLQQGITRRKTMEQAVRKSGGRSEQLLAESRQLQKYLQRLARRVLAAQEDKRKQISRELRNEIAQTLLGITVRLVTLKKEAAGSAARLEKDIANTQLLVDKSLKSINRFAREFGKRDET
jgi:signal transduction histidine kinase